MKINWKVRLKNPVFWVQIVVAVFLPMLTHMGLAWEDMITWRMVAQVLMEAIKNPVVVVAVAVSVWNAINDPTENAILFYMKD